MRETEIEREKEMELEIERKRQEEKEGGKQREREGKREREKEQTKYNRSLTYFSLQQTRGTFSNRPVLHLHYHHSPFPKTTLTVLSITFQRC